MNKDAEYLVKKYRGMNKVLAMLKKNDIYSLSNLNLLKRLYDNSQSTVKIIITNAVCTTQVIMHSYLIHVDGTNVVLTDVALGDNNVVSLNLKRTVPSDFQSFSTMFSYKTEVRIY